MSKKGSCAAAAAFTSVPKMRSPAGGAISGADERIYLLQLRGAGPLVYAAVMELQLGGVHAGDECGDEAQIGDCHDETLAGGELEVAALFIGLLPEKEED